LTSIIYIIRSSNLMGLSERAIDRASKWSKHYEKM